MKKIKYGRNKAKIHSKQGSQVNERNKILRTSYHSY